MSSEPYGSQAPYAPSRGWSTEQVSGQSPQSAGPEALTPSPQMETAPGSAVGGLPMAPTPSIDLIENTDEIWVFIDLPGFKPEEIQLEGDPRTLHVSATRPSEIEDGRNVLINERTVQIDRVIQFPTDVEMDEIDAVFDDGVCKITVPKAASERYREIDIRSP